MELEEPIEVYRSCPLGEELTDLEVFILTRRGEKERDGKQILLQRGQSVLGASDRRVRKNLKLYQEIQARH